MNFQRPRNLSDNAGHDVWRAFRLSTAAQCSVAYLHCVLRPMPGGKAQIGLGSAGEHRAKPLIDTLIPSGPLRRP